MKVTYKDFGVECSIEEINALVGLFNADISNAVDALREKMDFKVKVRNEGTEERNDISKAIDALTAKAESSFDEAESDEPTIEDVMAPPVEKNQKDIVWVTNTQLMQEFNLRSTSTLHYHINHGFKDYRRAKTGNKRETILVDRDAFAEWYAAHQNPVAKGERPDAKRRIPNKFTQKMEEVFDISGCEGWAASERNRCREAGLEPGKAFSTVYRRMTKDYGVVFEQLRKDYIHATGHRPESTYEMVYWLEHTDKNYERLFEGILTNVIKESGVKENGGKSNTVA